MKNLFSLKSTLVLGLGFILVSCDDDDGGVVPPTPVNEEELITTLHVGFAPIGGSATKTFTFQDMDGDGGNAPVITTEPLDNDSTYIATVTLLNEQESPAEDITLEVKAEGAEHQLFYEYQSMNGPSDITISYEDLDSNGKPIGVVTRHIVDGPGTGLLKVTLRHEPNKSAAGVEAGDIQNAGGETDIEVTFNVEIQ